MVSNEVAAIARLIDADIADRNLPTTESLRLEDPVEVARVLTQLADNGSVTTYRDGREPVFYLEPQQALQAAYYRNTIVHFFVPGAIAELALLDTAGDGAVERFWERVMDLRDLLKFEFFFASREQFVEDIRTLLEAASPTWESDLAEPSGDEELITQLDLLRAHWALLPFLEAYLIVADQLVRTIGLVDDRTFVDDCLALGEQYRLQGLVKADESVSKVLFATALRLARNRGLTDEEGGPEQLEARRAFARSVADLCRRARQVGDMADARIGVPRE